MKLPFNQTKIASPSTLVFADQLERSQQGSLLKPGDEKAFDRLVQAHYRVLFNYATRFTKDRDLIKDCIQDLFLDLWNRRRAIVDSPFVTMYLIKSLRNNLLRKIRREKGWYVSPEEGSELTTFSTDGLTAETEWIAMESMTKTEQDLRTAIDLLPKRQQEVVLLKFYEGLSNDDIAQSMNIHRQTVANFLYRAMTQLRTCLANRVSI